MELIKVKNASYARYEELLVKREEYNREAESILVSYTKEFGELISEGFKEKIECIRLKKAISYCQAQINKGDNIDTGKLQTFLDHYMAMYNAELQSMLKQNEEARNAKTVSLMDEERSKKLYRKLTKMLHPDINPETMKNQILMDLWNRILAAYHSWNPVELAELEVLVNKAIQALGLGVMEIEIPDIELKIQLLEDEISDIITTEPYIFSKLLEDAEAVKTKKSELTAELEKYRAYHKELDEVLEKLISNGGTHIIWKMN